MNANKTATPLFYCLGCLAEPGWRDQITDWIDLSSVRQAELRRPLLGGRCYCGRSHSHQRCYYLLSQRLVWVRQASSLHCGARFTSDMIIIMSSNLAGSGLVSEFSGRNWSISGPLTWPNDCFLGSRDRRLNVSIRNTGVARDKYLARAGIWTRASES